MRVASRRIPARLSGRAQLGSSCGTKNNCHPERSASACESRVEESLPGCPAERSSAAHAGPKIIVIPSVARANARAQSRDLAGWAPPVLIFGNAHSAAVLYEGVISRAPCTITPTSPAAHQFVHFRVRRRSLHRLVRALSRQFLRQLPQQAESRPHRA